MSFSRHITRNFNANKTHRIRYDKDDFICHIYKLDKTKEQQYSAYKKNLTYENGEFKNWHGMKVLKSKNKKDLILKFTYDANEASSNYRLEFLFANTYLTPTKSKKDKTLKSGAKIYVNGELQDQQNGSKWNSSDVNFNRHYQYVTLEEGPNTIEYHLVSNSVFIGLCIKRYVKYEARRHNNDNDMLTLIKATVEHTNELSINTMTAEFMYHHKLDEVLDPTDSRANRSGLIFDYRDEINLYVFDTEGNKQLVFGGYISTADVDDDLTKVTLQCADRLIDLDRRYNLSEITMKDEEPKDDYSYSVDYLKNYDYYSSALKYLLKSTELPMKTNVQFGNSLVARNNWKLATYKKGATEHLSPTNMLATANEKSMTLRNGDDTLKGQKVTIYNNKSRNVCLNDYPNLFFHYGMGTQKWTEEYEVVTTVTSEASLTKTQQKWLDRANDITKATGNSCIQPIWQWVATNIQRTYTPHFYQSAETTWKKKKGNCCCKTEVMLNLLNAKGITDLKYVHTHGGKGGHVFAKVNGYYVDPSSSSKSRGWHNYIHGYGPIVKVTDYPTKPF